MKLQIGEETPVCPNIWYFLADVLLYLSLNVANLFDGGEMVGWRMTREARSEAV